ncbi:MAG: NAD(P)/FAD-dependent oxidoreductase [Gammaproteobacteria bacterium]|nr:NAD(P)/FAD-dependent oxidoreductase [Gammaproteobacteria bacterium]
MKNYDVIIIGASAAGLMCAIEAGKRKRRVLVIDHANKVGKKILMSGGGRCNFTNLEILPERYLSHNPHFCKSALKRYTQWDFIKLVNEYAIPHHTKTLGQLFCDHKASDIVNMLLAECTKYNVEIKLDTLIKQIEKLEDNFQVNTQQINYSCGSLVIATGGLSIPTMGASPFGYKIAEQFNLKVWPTRAGLVALTLHDTDKQKYAALSGIAIDSIVSVKQQTFRENILFTHRGLSGPAILQISSYWQPGEILTINLLPDLDLLSILKQKKGSNPKSILKTELIQHLPKHVIETFFTKELLDTTLATMRYEQFAQIVEQLQAWQIKPNNTEGYRTAEVTLGGVDCDAISSQTMEARTVPGLYFIGEVLDVTGWLGGYNFQWAWSSGWVAGQNV